VRRKRTTEGVTVNAFAGTNVVSLGWDVTGERRKGCLGFAVQREDHTEDERYWMTGMKTFAETDPGLGPGGQVSSRLHPFQAFQWADYSAKPDHDYTYTVIPMYGKPKSLEPGPRASVRIRTEPELAVPHSVFVNRGSVASQEYARRFMDIPPSKLHGEQRDAAYKWLSRGLFESFVAFVERAGGKNAGLYGAFYEFQWPDALRALRAAGDRGADVCVLYDAIPSKTGPKQKNEDAIKAANLGGQVKPRTVGKIMHNKFLVLTKGGKPVAVWTGSTNLTENGIFGHMNVGHIVEDPDVAQRYLEYWKELGGNPDSKTEKAWMGEHNANPPDPWKADLTSVFSPHSGDAILDWYAEIAGGAKKALFMTFAFGMNKRFLDVYRKDDDILRVALMEKEGNGRGLAQGRKDIAEVRRRRNVLVAIGHRIEVNAFDRWLREMSKITSEVNVYWVHTKFMLVDPLSSDPVVITGSANFSESSTDENNENMLVIRGDTRVADIYLGEFMRTYSHYAFRESVARAKAAGDTHWNPRNLEPGPGWQKDYFSKGDDRSLRREYFAQTGS
jgi:phosphatidylserine/phosphatidylglycerophosphate/cardiolipin synthase-like enzyme